MKLILMLVSNTLIGFLNFLAICCDHNRENGQEFLKISNKCLLHCDPYFYKIFSA